MALCEQNMATLGRCSAQTGLYLVFLNTSWCSGGPILQMQRGKNCTTYSSLNNEVVFRLPSAHFDGSLWQAQWEEWWWGPLPQSRALLSFGWFPSFPIGEAPLSVQSIETSLKSQAEKWISWKRYFLCFWFKVGNPIKRRKIRWQGLDCIFGKVQFHF